MHEYFGLVEEGWELVSWVEDVFLVGSGKVVCTTGEDYFSLDKYKSLLFLINTWPRKLQKVKVTLKIL